MSMRLDTLPLVYDKQSAIAWSRAVLGDHDVVFLDTETTGLDDQSEVIEIAIVDRDGETLVNSLVRPIRPIPAPASAIHGILDREVAEAPTWAEFFPTISSICRDRTVIVYNADYDLRLIRQSCRLAGMNLFTARFHCAMQAFACFHAGRATSGRPKNQRLESAANRFSLDIPNHRALGDALACLGVVRGMAHTT
jgi:DNA polymerase-3 subunit epsilon